MTTSDYINSKVFNSRIEKVMVTANDDPSENILKPLLSNLLIETFNDGIIANMTEKEKISKETLLKKSKEITNFLPAHFKNTDTGKKLVEIIMTELLNNTTDYVLNIGYETIFPEIINNVLRVAYSVGITTGFEIANDKELKSIYTANVERFLKSGKVGED